ncbi:MAG: GTPase HflX [Caldisericia bacterium]|jgi:GTP-binding protein HflX|nr:GTPase HflX [Caldisericia bacterium]
MVNTLNQIKENRAVLIGFIKNEINEFLPEETLNELELLTETLGLKVTYKILKRLREINPKYYIGKGALEEIKLIAQKENAKYLIFDETLSYSQIKNISEYTNLYVLDRPHLIIEIFEKRAKTNEAKIQVELARLKMELPAIIGIGKSLDQQMGIVGIRAGRGEKLIELKRRAIERRINNLNKELKKIEKRREIRRKLREKSQIPVVSIVGYTNSGKSTLFNALTNEETYTENMLFATLDTLVRKAYLKKYDKEILVIDTVGFIQKLPPLLISSFKSTLEEINYSDLIIHLIDASSPSFKKHMISVKEILDEILYKEIKILNVYNKIDLLNEYQIERIKKEDETGILISALKKINIDELKDKIGYELFERADILKY